MPSRILSSSARTSVCGEAVVEAAAAASGETATAAALPTARPSSVRRESGAAIELSPVVRAPGERRVLGPRYRLMQVSAEALMWWGPGLLLTDYGKRADELASKYS